MSGSTGNMPTGAADRPERRERVMNLQTARRMLPLVQRIIEDVRSQQQIIEKLQPEQDRLDRHRRDLSWPERQRRYQVSEEIHTTDRKLQEALTELDELGIVVLDTSAGRVGFPTLVNERAAFFAWWPGQDGITCWHFAEEERTRPIPPHWNKSTDISLTSKS